MGRERREKGSKVTETWRQEEQRREDLRIEDFVQPMICSKTIAQFFLKKNHFNELKFERKPGGGNAK